MSEWNPKVPMRYEKAVYEDVPLDIQAAFEHILKTRRGLYIYGDVGTGKTHIAYALHKNAPKAHIKTMFRNTVELFKDLRDDISRDSYSKTRPVENLTEYPGILILDDIGVEKATDFVLESLYLIINKRYNEMLPMIFTSNFSLDELSDRVGDRIPSRIAESCQVVHLQGADRRLIKG